MGTAATTVEIPAVTKDQFSYAVVEVETKDDKGNVEVSHIVKPEDAAQEMEKKGEGKILLIASASGSYPNSFAGIQEIFASNEKEAAKLLSNGLDVKYRNKFKQILLAKDENGNFTFEAPASGSFDLTQYAAEESRSRGVSTFDKAIKLLSGQNILPEQAAQLMEMLKQIQQQ